MRKPSVLILLAMVLPGCQPGLVLSLYNATGDTLTITNPPFRQVTIIQPNTAADGGTIGGGVLIRSFHQSWFYPSQRSSFPPISLYQQHTMLWRAFGRIDGRGRIYLLAPPRDQEALHEITQPAGFPLRPQTRPNQAMQRTAGRSAFQLSMTSPFNLQPHAPSPAVADLVSR
jgi:hypothetical protein